MPGPRTFEQDAHAFKVAILYLAAQHQFDSAVIIAALADVLGLTAAYLDLSDHVVSFETRIDSVLTRSKQAYLRTMANRERVLS